MRVTLDEKKSTTATAMTLFVEEISLKREDADTVALVFDSDSSVVTVQMSQDDYERLRQAFRRGIK